VTAPAAAGAGGDGITARAFRLTDSTLPGRLARDPAPVRPAQQVTDIDDGLDKAGVAVLEVSHGDGLGGSSFSYGFSGTPEQDLISAAVAAATYREDRLPADPRHRHRRRPARRGRSRRLGSQDRHPTAPRRTSPSST